jgi:hypothetical protein
MIGRSLCYVSKSAASELVLDAKSKTPCVVDFEHPYNSVVRDTLDLFARPQLHTMVSVSIISFGYSPLRTCFLSVLLNFVYSFSSFSSLFPSIK